MVPWFGRGETRDIDGALVPARARGEVSMEPPERRDGGYCQCAGMACVFSWESLNVPAGPWRLGAAALVCRWELERFWFLLVA